MIILGENTYFNNGYKGNGNNLVVGSPGSCKTRGFVLPNICECDNESIIILDAKNEIYNATHSLMERKGYKIQRISFADPRESTIRYNPFNFIQTQEDIIAFSNILVEHTHTVDTFWVDCARILNNALSSYLLEVRPEHQRSLHSIYKLLRVCTAYEDDNRPSKIDLIFRELKEKLPTSWAGGQFDLVKNSAARTFRSVAITLSSAFSHMLTEDIIELTSPGGIQLDPESFCREKTALYINISDVERSRDKLACLFFTQLLQQLYKIADKSPDRSLPRPVLIMLDDIGANLQIPNLEGYLSTSRGRDISFSLILQSFGQLKKNYKDITSIISSCNNILFMGSNDLETCQNIAERLNRPLADVLYKDKGTVFVFQQGHKPISTKAYDLRSHRNYPLLKDNYVTEKPTPGSRDDGKELDI